MTWIVFVNKLCVNEMFSVIFDHFHKSRGPENSKKFEGFSLREISRMLYKSGSKQIN